MNKKSIITKTVISSLITLIPTIIALVCHLFFKEKMYLLVSKAIWDATIPFSIFIPVVLVLVNVICIILSFKLESKQQNRKIINLTFSIIPFLSLFTNVVMWASIMESKINMFSVMSICFGILFAVIGNLMPKTSQNKTFGIKIHWTLSNEENWNATHRFAGKIWFFAGLVFIICAFLPEKILLWAFFVTLAIIVISPIAYSFAYYQKQVNNGTWNEAPPKAKNKKTVIVSTIISVIIVIFCIILTVTGEINVKIENERLIVEATYWSDANLDISEIDKIELSSSVKGQRISGFASGRLLMGTFKSDSLGTYTRYTYTKNKTAIIITIDNNIYVINAKTDSETREIYETLLNMWGK